METKLTLSMDEEVIEAAKRYARLKNTSLSRLIKNYLISITSSGSHPDSEITPLVKNLSGLLKLEEGVDTKKQYADYLSRKYQ